MERQIMGNIFRLCAKSRRRTGEGKPAKCRGYGRIMELLYSGDGYTQQEIAKKLDIRPQSASEAIGALCDQGFASKEAMEDKRCNRIVITEAGRQHHAQLVRERDERAKALLAPLTDGEKRTLLMLLQKVNEGGAEDGR